MVSGNPENCKAKILISEDWVHNNLPKITGDQTAYKYKPLPPLLELSDSEKFRDEQGNVHEVEVRGEKMKNGIWFSWSDISRLFEMPATYHLSQKLDQQNMGVYQASTYLTYEECWIDPNMIYSVRAVIR